MERNRIKLNNEKSQRDVNVDMYQNIHLTSDSKPLPYNDIKRVINENEQFNVERQSTTKYRIVSTINGIFTNVLFNSTGPGSWETLNLPIFRDRSFPPDGVSLNQDEDYSYEESIAAHLKERDGWFGYMNPRLNGYADNEFYLMEPTKDKFSLVHRLNPNWGITITYPAVNLTNELTDGGLKITSLKEVTVGGKKMTAFGTPYRHNLSLRDDVKISGSENDGVYSVMRLGLNNGDFQGNYFVIDVPFSSVRIDDARFKKVYSGVECEYYFRVFKKVNTADGTEFSNKDYDIYPLAFSKNLFNDTVYQFATKDDVDVSGLTDNLGRPVTEIHVGFIKKNNKGFTDIKSGLNITDVGGLEIFKDIPDIRKIHNGAESNTALNDSVLSEDSEFIGDLVEYNKMLLKETVLNEVNHRFNTLNREEGGDFDTALPKKVTRTVTRTATPYTETTETPTDVETVFYNSNPRTGQTFGQGIAVLDDGFGDGSTDQYDSGFSYAQVLWYYGRTKLEACTNPNPTILYTDNARLMHASFVAITVEGDYKGRVGWYTNKAGARYWDGTSFGTYEFCGTVETVETGGEDGDMGDETEFTPNPVALGVRQEGYMYKPFHRIQLRNFSDYIEYGDEKTYGIPDYAEKLEDGRYIWRDLMDIGNVEKDLDYPFLNGRHYIHKNHLLAVKRQDPFGDNKLLYTGDVPDIAGIRMTDKYKTKKSGDIC